jgi:hypothetical protein
MYCNSEWPLFVYDYPQVDLDLDTVDGKLAKLANINSIPTINDNYCKQEKQSSEHGPSHLLLVAST